ncbi:HesA/MoeB/ThiF family protein [Phaeobacter sp. PT47_59]|uniref:HesA/MoeB/ThiF family protein n=1 Tax=Phaeobacter sp. PT47_59 TaxID=3029979 RepID=UPI00237FE1FF|nr:HesA/MoeB/ThiF family protein [Phaeobacter sp. PT47_59]MDE4176147.1 HesA/MoeB/ThiF family protein [Phaeobacter sp. PT47_59]
MSRIDRYARQIALPEVGASGQARLATAHVLIVGAGGLGCPALSYLAGAGVGEITLMDPDVVEESNLHRQPLYHTGDIGLPKVEAARRHLQKAHPALNLHAIGSALTPENAAAAIARADLVLDGADTIAASYILSDHCHAQGTPLISASALGQRGYVGGFCDGAPSLRALFPDPPDSGATCASLGVMGPLVGAIGALQAQMALKVLLGHDPSPLGQVISLDMADLRLSGFRFDDAEEPADGFAFIAPDTIEDGDYVIDLRPPEEAATAAAPQARRLPLQALAAEHLPKDRRIVLCCHSGQRAWRAARQLQQRGYDHLALLAVATT